MSYPLEIVTPNGSHFNGDADRVIVRAVDGDVCILQNHADYVVPLGIGKARIKTGEKERTASLNSGTLIVSGGTVRIIALTFEWAEDIDVDRAKAAKEKAEQRIKDAESDYDMRLAELKLKRALNRLLVAD